MCAEHSSFNLSKGGGALRPELMSVAVEACVAGMKGPSLYRDGLD